MKLSWPKNIKWLDEPPTLISMPRQPGKTTFIKNLSKKMENKQIHRTFLTESQIIELWRNRGKNRLELRKLADKFGCHMWTIDRKLEILNNVFMHNGIVPPSRYKAMEKAVVKILGELVAKREKEEKQKIESESRQKEANLCKHVKITSLLGGQVVRIEVGRFVIDIVED